MLKYGTAYVAQGLAEYEQQFRERMLHNLHRRAAARGFVLVPATR